MHLLLPIHKVVLSIHYIHVYCYECSSWLGATCTHTLCMHSMEMCEMRKIPGDHPVAKSEKSLGETLGITLYMHTEQNYAWRAENLALLSEIG